MSIKEAMMRLLPREEKFFDLFDQVAEKVVLAAEALEQALRTMGTWPRSASGSARWNMKPTAWSTRSWTG